MDQGSRSFLWVRKFRRYQVFCRASAFLFCANVAVAQTKLSSDAAHPVCINCHRNETLRYRATPMGQSFVAPQKFPDAVIRHPPSGSVLSVTTHNGEMFHELTQGGISATYPIRYQVGGGMEGDTFLIRIGDYLFESPLSWFNGYGWDVSPGYATKNVLEFDRGVSKECIYCHATGARFDDPDGRHLISKTLQPITCERCHGDSDEHLRHPSTSNILNPAKMAGPARDSICEQCHLEGTNRVLNPGKDWTDYHPGDAAEKIFATYVLQGSNQEEVPLASEVEQFAESRCARASNGKFWCSACHNPHREPLPRDTEIRTVCTSCHQKLSPTAHPTALKECTSCHMPTTNKVTISHASHTDHRILRYLPTENGPPQKRKLVVWRDPPQQVRQRDLGVAELMLPPEEDEDLWRDGAALLSSLDPKQLLTDAAAVSALENFYLRTDDLSKAVEFGRRSVELTPNSSTAALTFARVLEASGSSSEAEQQYLRAIHMDPSLKEAYGRLAVHYAKKRKFAAAKNILDRYLQWNPKDIFFHEMERRLVPHTGSSTSE